jgi:hypothetical protein
VAGDKFLNGRGLTWELCVSHSGALFVFEEQFHIHHLLSISVPHRVSRYELASFTIGETKARSRKVIN